MDQKGSEKNLKFQLLTSKYNSLSSSTRQSRSCIILMSLSLCSYISASLGHDSINLQSNSSASGGARIRVCTHAYVLHCECIQPDIKHSLVSFDTTCKTSSIIPSVSEANSSGRLAKRCELTYPGQEEQTQTANLYEVDFE